MTRHPKILTRSFAAGEMSPEMFSRLDDTMFQAGAETVLNGIPKPTGAVARRSGTRLVRQTRDSSSIAHLFSFVFSQDESVVIEGSRAAIGGIDSGYFRFHKNGGTLLFPHPEKQWIAPLDVSAAASFVPNLACDGSNDGGDLLLTTQEAHGLTVDNPFQFLATARTLPGGTLGFSPYYVVDVPSTTTFKISAQVKGTPIAYTDHWGYYASGFSWSKFRLIKTARQQVWIEEHRVPNKEPVIFTMWPDNLSPFVDFGATGFKPSRGPSPLHYNDGLARVAPFGQQVLFGNGTVPAGIEVGRIYWVTGYDKTTGYFTISETKGGKPHETQAGRGAHTARLCATPRILESSEGPGALELLRTYYAISNANEPNALKLEYSVGAGQTVGGGIETDPYHIGCGPFKLHRAYERGDIVASESRDIVADGAFVVDRRYRIVVGGTTDFTTIGAADSIPGTEFVATGTTSTGGPGTGTAQYLSEHLQCFYHERTWWDLEPQVLTEEMSDGSGPRQPGARARATEGAYWRELPGAATGGRFNVTANEYSTGSTDLVLSALEGDHGLQTGMEVAFLDGQLPSCTPSIGLDTPYYAIRDNATDFRLATTYAAALAGTAIVGPSSQSPRWGSLVMQAFVALQLDDYVSWPGHEFVAGDTIVFGKSDYLGQTPQTDIELGKVYYVRDVSGSDFRLSESAIGPLLTFTVDGDRLTAVGGSILEVPHSYSEEELPRIITTQSADVMTMASQDHPVTELRRLSSSKWELVEPEFVAAAGVPGPGYEVLVEKGEGFTITESAREGSRYRYVVTTAGVFHPFTAGTPVFVSGFPTSGLGALTYANGQPIPSGEGYFITADPSGGPPDAQRLNVYLRDIESGVEVKHAGNTTGLDARIRNGTQGEEQDNKYVVTAVDDNNEESAPNEPLTIENNLNVDGAANTFAWGAALGAVRYRVYKALNGIYGLIGETDELEFKDDNIGPDLGVAPPIVDESMRRTATVTFDQDADSVQWPGHELTDNQAVVFDTTDELPGLVVGQTYYVLNAGEDEFQVAETLTGNAVDITGTDLGVHTAVGGHFPATATYFEGRRVFGGSRAFPQDIWMTASGTESDMSYSIPSVDSDRIYFRIASREISPIRHLIPMSQLVLLSDSTEYRLSPVNDDAITPTSISVRPQSFVGANYPHPSLVNNTVVFAAARGGHMRELGFKEASGGYLTGDLSIRAAHLFDGFTILDQAYAKAPLPVVWCVSSSGKLLGLTYMPEEGVGAWHQHTTSGGLFESVAVVPEGDEDAVYVVVNRGGTRSVERFATEWRGETAELPDAYYVDYGVTYAGTPTTTVSGLDHLEGQSVAYLADGVPGTAVVASGAITLSTAASKIHVGLPMTSRIKTLPLTMMKVDAFGTGRQKNVDKVWVRIFQSGAFEAGVVDGDLRPSRTPAAGAVDSDLVEVVLPGRWTDDGQVIIEQATPLPLTVSGLTLEVASGG